MRGNFRPSAAKTFSITERLLLLPQSTTELGLRLGLGLA